MLPMKVPRLKRLILNFIKIFWVIFPISLFLVGIFILSYKSDFLVIKKIDCETSYGDCSDELLKKFSPLLGRNILTIERSEVQNLVEDDKQINTVMTKKRLPNNFLIQVEMKKPRVAIRSGDRFKLVDLEGEVLSEDDKTSLPILTLNEEVLGDNFKMAIKLLANLYAIGMRSNGELRSAQLVLQTNGTQVLVSRLSNPKLVAGSLHFMMQRFTMEGKQPRVIDMRFKNPIVTF